MRDARSRLEELERQAATASYGPCAACQDGRRAVVSYPDSRPAEPPACGMCGRTLLHVAIVYEDHAKRESL